MKPKRAFHASGSFRFTLLAVLVAGIGVGITVFLWDWLHPGSQYQASKSTTLRNVGLLIGGGLALVFAIWRGWIAERESDTARQQADINLRSSLNERYERGAGMLGSEILTVRLAGIYALERLAREDPQHYHVEIMKLLCAFARNPTGVAKVSKKANWEVEVEEPAVREDLQEVITAIGRRSESAIEYEKHANYRLNLTGADLSALAFSGLNLANADLSHANLRHAKFFAFYFPPPDLSEPIPSGPNQPLSRAVFAGEFVPSDLSGYEGRRANLSCSLLNDSDLSGADLMGVDLSGAQLVRAKLSKARMMYVNLRKAVLLNGDLSGASIVDSDLSGALLGGADLTESRLIGARLYGADFSAASLQSADLSSAFLATEDGEFRAAGLTQKQLDQVKVRSGNLPSLTGMVGLDTGKPLVWPRHGNEDQIARQEED